MYKTHSVAAIVATTAIMPTLNTLNLINNTEVLSVGLVFAGGLLGALLPDIDSPNSKISRIIRKALTGNPTSTKNIINHRRAPHMPLVWAVIFLALLYVTKNPITVAFIYGVAVGVYSHLAIDMLNPAGIPLLGPINRRKFSIFCIKANSTPEKIFAGLLVVLEIYIVFVLKIQVLNLHT